MSSLQQAAQLYESVLGRAPENAEVAQAWAGYIDSVGLEGARDAFMQAAAPELDARSQEIASDLYESVLWREPENQQVAQAWADYVEDVGVAGARNAFMQAASPELDTRSPELVDFLYEKVLARDPENTQVVQAWSDYIEKVGYQEAEKAFRQAAQAELDARTSPKNPTTTTKPVTGTQTGVTTTPISPSQSTLSPNFADYVYRMLAKGEQAANLPYQPYTGQRYAGVSPLQLQAFSGIANLADPAAFAEAQRFMTMAGTNAGNTFYTPTSFTTGLSPAPAGTTQPIGVASLPMGGAARNVNLPTVEEVVSRFGVTPGWNTQTPSTAIPTGQTLEGRFPEAEQTFADGGLASLATPQQNPFQLGDVASYMSPYMTNVMDIEAREARRQADIGRTAEQARLAQAGAYGGSRQAIMEAERQRNLQTQMGDIATKGLQSAYDRAMEQRLKESGLGLEAQKLGEQSRQFGAEFGLKGQQAQLQAGLGLGQLGVQQGQFGLDALKTMLGAGQTQQQLAQQPYDFGYQQWQESQNYPYKQATFMSSLLGGLPLAAAPYNTGTSGLSGLMQALGLALGGYKAFEKAGT